MTTPTCPRCKNSTFEIGEIIIKHANYRHNAIVCSMCGCIVGIEDWMNVPYMLGKLAEKLGVQFGS